MQSEAGLLCQRACSKINLFLKVTGKRADGYHTLESLFLPLAEPADDIAIDLEALPGAITVACSDVFLPGGMSNIAGKAADIWSKRSGVMPHWDINIVKNIPVAAGMGGGSSDGATVMKMLNTHANNPLNDAELAEAALTLGADVPFFLDPAPAIMTGIGETACKLDFELPDLNILLLAGNFPVSAAEGYRLMGQEKISPMDSTLRSDILQSLRSGDLEKFSRLIFNDLQDGVFNKFPCLKIIAQKVMRTDALCCLMTGSGPTLFAIYADSRQRSAAMEELRAALPEVRLIAAAGFNSSTAAL